jgi:co-chaperonin GroES (HSP10)
VNFKPIGTQIVLELEENKPQLGELVLPDSTVSMDFSMFIVRAVGEGFLTDGGYVPLPIKVGDRVHLRASAKGNMTLLQPWFVNDRKLCVVGVEHLLGVWEGEMPSPKLMRKIVTSGAACAKAN